jgi:hypothetical protein
LHQVIEALKLDVNGTTSNELRDLSVTRRCVWFLVDECRVLERPDLVEMIVNPVQSEVFIDAYWLFSIKQSRPRLEMCYLCLIILD